jgi:hypothetical protein
MRGKLSATLERMMRRQGLDNNTFELVKIHKAHDAKSSHAGTISVTRLRIFALRQDDRNYGAMPSTR